VPRPLNAFGGRSRTFYSGVGSRACSKIVRRGRRPRRRGRGHSTGTPSTVDGLGTSTQQCSHYPWDLRRLDANSPFKEKLRVEVGGIETTDAIWRCTRSRLP